MENAFELRQLIKTYGPRRVLDIEAAEIPAGKITALLGPNGCGKTTLLECLDALQKPTSGEILYFGKPLSAQSRRAMTLVFQNPYLYNSTVEYNVAWGMRLRGNRNKAAIVDALSAVHLAGFNRRNAKTLSGGEAKRVALARALAIKPDTLLLDEPTANIDIENVGIIEDAVKKMCDERGTTVVIATHSKSQAVRLAHQTFLIQDGRLQPYFPDNHFKGTLSIENKEKVFTIGDNLRAVVSTARPPGPASCTISPEDIIVSAAPLQSSARNSWAGKVTSIVLENQRVRITVDAGAPVVATVTIASYETIRPHIGDTIYFTFKASSVQIF